MRIRVFGMAAIIALAGCSHLGGSWTKPGASDKQRGLDAYACGREAGLVGMAFGNPQSDVLFRQCMEARGYAKFSR
jgi:hypothetical protein